MYITILPRDALSVLKRRGADLFQPVLDGDRIELGELVKMCVRVGQPWRTKRSTAMAGTLLLKILRATNLVL